MDWTVLRFTYSGINRCFSRTMSTITETVTKLCGAEGPKTKEGEFAEFKIKLPKQQNKKI